MGAGWSGRGFWNGEGEGRNGGGGLHTRGTTSVALWGGSHLPPPPPQNGRLPHTIQAPQPQLCPLPWGHFFAPPNPPGVTSQPSASMGCRKEPPRCGAELGGNVEHLLHMGRRCPTAGGGGGSGGRGSKAWGGAAPMAPPVPPHRQRRGNVPEMENLGGGGAPWGLSYQKTPKRWGGSPKNPTPPPKIKGPKRKGGLPKPKGLGSQTTPKKGSCPQWGGV